MPEQVSWSLAESDGRLYVCMCIKVDCGSYVQYWAECYGPAAGQDDGRAVWGNVDSFTQLNGDSFSFDGGPVWGRMSAMPHDERGLVDGSRGGGREDVDGGKYTLVRELYTEYF